MRTWTYVCCGPHDQHHLCLYPLVEVETLNATYGEGRNGVQVSGTDVVETGPFGEDSSTSFLVGCEVAWGGCEDGGEGTCDAEETFDAAHGYR
mmetsp:Transcript_40246/g.48776  ORF Transcript_40246/g.48776 Transcript_40246/m.48776 type:complete len:93 (-) Transcript_40246:185-463(-)